MSEELTQDGYCYRFRPDERPLGEAEGAFLLCGYFMSLAYSQRGDHVDAARWFERSRAACGPSGLCSEEFDVAPAPAARQPPTGLRPRAAARVRRRAGPARGGGGVTQCLAATAPEDRARAAPRLLITLDDGMGLMASSAQRPAASQQTTASRGIRERSRQAPRRPPARPGGADRRPARTASRILAGSVVDGLHAISMLMVARNHPSDYPNRRSRARPSASLLSCYGLRCGLHRR